MDSLKKKINNIQAVRHIQRGTFTPSDHEVSITLSGFNNVNKMMVLLDGSNYVCYHSSNYGYGYNIDPIVTSLTKDKLTIATVHGTTSNDVRDEVHSYQVIEFY